MHQCLPQLHEKNQHTSTTNSTPRSACIYEHYFALSPESDITSKLLIKKLKQFPEVGNNICGRKRSKKLPDMKCFETKILQLIATNIISINISKDEPTVTFRLGLTDAHP